MPSDIDSVCLDAVKENLRIRCEHAWLSVTMFCWKLACHRNRAIVWKILHSQGEKKKCEQAGVVCLCMNLCDYITSNEVVESD